MTFNVTDGAKSVGVDCAGACFANVPDLFREGQGVVAEGTLAADGRLSAEAILAKHDERYMPREVVEALKRQGLLAGRRAPSHDRRSGPFRADPRLRAVAGAGERAARRRAARRSGADGGRDERRARPVRPRRARLRRARLGASDVRLLGAQRRREFAQRRAGDLQVLGRVGQSRRLDAAVDADPGGVRRHRRRLRPLAARRGCAPTRSPCRG